MKSIVYYCGENFDPSCGQELSAVQWLQRKILHARELHHYLAHLDYQYRNDKRINDISKAIKDWETQLDEIFGHSREIE